MSRFDPALTADVLNAEYVDWYKRHGNGRSHRDLRFGQYIVNKYLTKLSAPDIFYQENAANVFTLLYSELNIQG